MELSTTVEKFTQQELARVRTTHQRRASQYIVGQIEVADELETKTQKSRLRTFVGVVD